MKRILLIVLGIAKGFAAGAQEPLVDRNTNISFFSAAPIEDIAASSSHAFSAMDCKKKTVYFKVPIKSFQFKKALMQEHFNADYAESSKFPKAEFKGQVTNNSAINYTTDGNYIANVKGQLTIHGVTKAVETTGTVNVNGGKITLSSTFNVLVADYNITIEKLYRDNIAKSIKITVDCVLGPLQ